jgi:pimeloyl-ACP methyl ester carboxylesterase
VLAWAHYSAGLAARCAPSRAGVTDELLAISRPFLADGFVVVASDYEGLGTRGPHPYMVGLSAGRSVLDSLRAALRVDGSGQGASVAILGLSQGGHAALWAAELAPTYAPELEIRAVAAVAPGGDLAGIARMAFGPDGTTVARLNIVMALSAWHEVYGLPIDTLLTAKGRERAVSLQSTCPDYSAPPSEPLLAADPGSEPGWREQVAANTPGASRAKAPILIVQGTRDEQVPLETTLTAVSMLRDVGDDVELRVLDGGDHESGLFGPGRLDELHAWIVERAGDSGTDRPTGPTSG